MSSKERAGLENDKHSARQAPSDNPGYVGLTQLSIQQQKYRKLGTGQSFRKRLVQIPTHTQIFEAKASVIGLSEGMQKLLSFNRGGQEFQLNIIFSQVLWLSLILAIYFVTQGVTLRLLAAPMWLDIFIQLITLHLYHSYPAEFLNDPQRTGAMTDLRLQEIMSIIKKVVLSLLVTFYQLEKNV